MDDSINGGTGTGGARTGGSGGGTGAPPPTTPPDPTTTPASTTTPAAPPVSATSVWANAPPWSDSPTFDVAVGSPAGPTPPTSTVDLGMAATTTYGLQFMHTTGMYSQAQVGGQCCVQVSPEALLPSVTYRPGWAEFRAVAASNVNCTLGPSANILFGRTITINHGPEEIKLNGDGQNLLAGAYVFLISAVVAAYGVACYLLADNELWGQEKEGNLVFYYQAAMQVLLTACLVGYIADGKHEEKATAKLFELYMLDKMSVSAP